jgi:protein O-GlcNAc transferase
VQLAAGLFELHDRSGFEVVAVSYGEDDGSPMRRRLEHAFERFLDVRARSDAQAAALLREMEIDIAVDLKGFTAGARPGILAQRPAPLQASYLGFPGTLGVPFIDYLIADRIVVPESEQACYAEKLVYLPECYQVNDASRAVAERTPAREEAGLPARGLVFCCFNNNYKILPETFACWMRLLREVPGSVLWLLKDSDAARANLEREARDAGIDPARLVFAARLPHAEHLARHRLADLFLDTLPYNAHTTASDALWAGLPVLTCTGTSFAGRVAASLLHAVGLPELVTRTRTDYEQLALALARDPQRLESLKEKLERNRKTAVLFDTARFARALETAYRTMWQRWCRGEPARSFAVERTP